MVALGAASVLALGALTPNAMAVTEQVTAETEVITLAGEVESPVEPGEGASAGSTAEPTMPVDPVAPTTPAETADPALEPTESAGEPDDTSTPPTDEFEIADRDPAAVDELSDEPEFGVLAEGPDGGTAPYVYWDVRDVDTNDLVPGATFNFQHRSSFLGSWYWSTGTNAAAISDCNGTCSTNTNGNFLDRDPDGGEYLLEHRGTIRNSTNRLTDGSNYSVQQVTPPAGYEWVVTTGNNNRKTIGGDNNNTGTWNGQNGEGTHNFETFLVRKIPTVPVCTAGYVYGISSTGQLRQVTPAGTVTNIGASASGVSSFNGLGIGSGGEPVFAYERSSPSSNTSSSVSIYKYDAATEKWASSNHAINSNDGSRTVLFVAGAVNLQNDKYYVGGFNSSGTRFRLWEYDPLNNTSKYKGEIDTSPGSQQTNGDLTFDSNGNLFVVRGSGSTTTVFSVTASNLAAADGGTIQSSPSTSVETMNNVNGVAFDASGKAFLGSETQLRSYDMPGWSNSSTVVSSGLNSTDLATCSSPPTITIEKYIEGGRVASGDQFELTLMQGNQLIGEATTTGTAIDLQDKRVGPLPTVRGVPLTFSEVGAGSTDLGNYVTSYRCLVDGKQTEQGNARTGTITIPPDGQSVECRFYNSPLIADIVVHKEVTDIHGENPTPRADWSVGATVQPTTGTVTTVPTSANLPTDGDGNASWELRFNDFSGRAAVTVSETQQTGYEFLRGQCVVTHLDGTTTQTNLESESGHQLTDIAPGDNVDCTYVNKPKPGSVAWNKVDDSTPAVLLGGSEWTITGPGFPDEGEPLTDCAAAECTGLDKDPVEGQFRLEELAWGDYTVTETSVPDGYTGGASFTFVVDKDNAGTLISIDDQVNVRILGSVVWNKVDEDEKRLSNSVWSLQGPGEDGDAVTFEDCVADSADGCTGSDKDPAAGGFKVVDLEWGDYVLTETRAPAGYYPADPIPPFTIGAGDPVELDVDLGDVVNRQIDGPALPLTGGLGRDFFTITGLGILVLGLGAMGVTQVRHRREVA